MWEFEDELEDEMDCTLSENIGDQDPHQPTDPIVAVKPSMVKVIGFVCTFLLSWQAIFKLPDIAIGIILKFLSTFFLKLSEITGSEDLKAIHKMFPDNLKHAQKVQGINRDDYERLVVCHQCHSMYRYADCMGENGISRCTFVRFPRDSQKRMRMPCNTPLMKTIKVAGYPSQ